MEQRQRKKTDRVRAEDRPRPRVGLQPRFHVGVVTAQRPFCDAGRAAAHQQHRRIVGADRRRWPRATFVDEQQVREIVIAGRERRAIAVFLFAKQREQHLQVRREELFDVGRDHPFYPRAGLNVLHAPVEARQRDDRFDLVRPQRPFEFVVGVDRIQWRDNRAKFPRSKLRDKELRTVWEQQRDAIAASDPERRERRRARIAQPVERGVGHRRAFEEQCRRVGPVARCVGEIVDERARRIRLECRRHALVIVKEPGRRRGHAGILPRQPTRV